jgi:hypothetical protein
MNATWGSWQARGAYLLWFAPGVPVFIDSRVDPYPDALLRAHIRDEATGNYRATFARYGITCALLPPESPTAHALQRDGCASPTPTPAGGSCRGRRRSVGVTSAHDVCASVGTGAHPSR